MSLNSYLSSSKTGQIMTINKGNLFVFEVGQSVKFVLAIIDAIFDINNFTIIPSLPKFDIDNLPII